MEFEAATNSNGTVSPIRGILSLASDDAAAAEEAFPELAEEAAVAAAAGEAVREEVKEGAAAPPPPPFSENCKNAREEGAGNSSVANVDEVKEEKGEGVTNSSASECVVAPTRVANSF